LKKSNILFIIPALAVIILDQASKIIVAHAIGFYQTIPLINGLVNLVHVRNRGMAFGLMNRPDAGVSFYFLIAVTIVAILLILFWFTRIKQEDKKLLLGLSLILGGAIGNLIDRIRLREVIDFVDVYIRSYHWPAFNVADSAITIGAIWIAIIIIFFEHPDTGEKNAS
jgi:signal peptidase II